MSIADNETMVSHMDAIAKRTERLISQLSLLLLHFGKGPSSLLVTYLGWLARVALNGPSRTCSTLVKKERARSETDFDTTFIEFVTHRSQAGAVYECKTLIDKASGSKHLKTKQRCKHWSKH